MPSNDLLTPQQVADELQLDYRTILKMLRKGTIPHINAGYKTKRIRRSALDDYLRQCGDETCS